MGLVRELFGIKKKNIPMKFYIMTNINEIFTNNFYF